MLKIFRTFLSIFAFAAMAHCTVIEPAMASVHEAHEASCMDVGHDDACCHVHHVLILSDSGSSMPDIVSFQNILFENLTPSVGTFADIFRPPRG